MYSNSSTSQPALWSITPFVMLLLAIAILPMVNRKFWDKYYPQISIGLGTITVAYYAIRFQDWHTLAHSGMDYLGFMALLGSLFTVTGGIRICVQGRTKTMHNILFLTTGAILSNVLGTTGASLLLIRPWMQWNRERLRPYHVVFFIFIVSNTGGCLTPIGDPPLFLGYLAGIPFFWPAFHLWQAWLVMNLGLLALFGILSLREAGRHEIGENPPDHHPPTWQIYGLHNTFFLAIILVAIFLPSPWRELLMVGSAAGSYFSSSGQIRVDNQFNFHPLKELGWLFLGIFATMAPALDYLRFHAADTGLQEPIHYFFACGLLSGFLDNAPTYLTFLAAAMAGHHLNLSNHLDIVASLDLLHATIRAISLGAIFFGASTYIGNGPNFMVRSIAEQFGVPMPSFFAYIFHYTLPCLLPLLLLTGWLFAR